MTLTRNLLYVSLLLCVIISLLSNSSGVPQAVSNAPGEANDKSCRNCHLQGVNFNPSITLDVMNPDSTIVHAYEPGNNYIVRVRVSGSNNPKSYGFQMVSLTSADTTDMGSWSGLGEKVKQISLTVKGKVRKYLEQSAPKVNGIFTANWKAPSTDRGNIVFYFAGLAVNLNGGDTGDHNVTNNLTLMSPSTSGNSDTDISLRNVIYPNPVYNAISIKNSAVHITSFLNISGQEVMQIIDATENIDVSHLTSGLYFAVFKNAAGVVTGTQKFIKL
ncbi:MAG: T9SS type A sorting domain-containing protein [Saprospiraceae bacterium]|nr:T9SS type A sorting domain-containing protein [Saprospiraceae bacterium]